MGINGLHTFVFTKDPRGAWKHQGKTRNQADWEKFEGAAAKNKVGDRTQLLESVESTGAYPRRKCKEFGSTTYGGNPSF